MDSYSLIKLSNGLRLLTIPMPSVQSATVMIMVNTGSRNETKEINGLSHFIEHMAFKGTPKRPTSKEIASLIEGIGGEFNAYTSKHTIGYYIKSAVKHVELSCDVLSDILANPLLKEMEIEREKGVIVEEINMYEDLPYRRAIELFEGLLYQNSPLGYDIAGSRETVKSLKRLNFVKYLKDYYFPQNMAVAVVGGISASKAKALVEKYFTFKNFDNNHLEIKRPNEKFIQKKPEILLKKKKTDQAHLVIGFRGNPLGHPDRYIENVLSAILGGGMSSRMFLSVRERRGLAYYVKTELEHYVDNGYIATRAGVDLTRLDKAVEVILNEYRKISGNKTGITQKEIHKAKEYLKGSLILSMEDSSEVADFHLHSELLENKPRTVKETFKGIDKVTIADVKRVAKEFFVPERLNMTLISPFDDKKRFEKLLLL